MDAERRRILIVEDSPTMCQLYRMVLGARPDVDLIFANDGLEGLDRLSMERDLALMVVDINMPQLDGLAFLRRAREELGVIDVPALVVSTEGEESDRRAAFEAGATEYLRKPWSPAEFLTVVDRLIEAPRRT